MSREQHDLEDEGTPLRSCGRVRVKAVAIFRDGLSWRFRAAGGVELLQQVHRPRRLRAMQIISPLHLGNQQQLSKSMPVWLETCL